MSGFIPIIFALLLIYFVITYDWSKTKIKSWMTYLFVVILVCYIIHAFLLILNIDIWTQIKDAKVMDTLLQKIQQ